KPAGTACPDDGNVCTLDQCDGDHTSCVHPAGHAGTVCRSAAGACDVAAACTGTSPYCPTNSLKAAGTVCRPAAGACDVEETCTGTSAYCPANTFKTHSTVCRPAAGVCDVTETCTG